MANREIKFRAWDCVLGMRPVLELAGDGSWWEVETSEGVYTLSNGSPMQFTGLKDKNGVEIYEGDIVEHYGYGEDSDYTEETPQSRHEVTLENFRLWLKDEGLDVELEYLIEPDECAVIGNIYENPELLKTI